MKNYLENNSMQHMRRNGEGFGRPWNGGKIYSTRDKGQTLKYVQVRHFFVMIYTRMNFLKYHLEYV
jgi:hypothetical protein